jgi:hypothetical protein
MKHFCSNLINVARQLTGKGPYTYDAKELAIAVARQDPGANGGGGGGSAYGDIFSGQATALHAARVEAKSEMNILWKFLILGSIAFCSSSVQAKAWRGIEPLHSTRADVERLLGSKVVRCGGSACIYELGEEIIFVLYATDSHCKNDDATTAWRVRVGTVIEIGVHFKKDKLLSELPFDLSKFERVEDEHLPGWIYYVNIDEGVRVEGGLKTASSVTYFQSAKDNHLSCRSINKVKER